MSSVSSSASSTVSEPLLSDTYKSSQLWTPRFPNRMTVDNTHYQGFVAPPNGIYKRVMLSSYGDRDFHIHKDIPVKQMYSLTSLRLSNLRHTDQLVDNPLQTNEIIAKEIQLPFPQEHPFTSHTPQFALFPDTQPHPPPPAQPQHVSKLELDQQDDSNEPETVNAGTQTGIIGVAQPPYPYYVKHKAFTRGIRVEKRFIGSSHAIPLVKEHGGMLWDIPRSQRHKRAYTYPAPSLQYSRPLTTPRYIPPPSTGALSSSTSNPMITPNTQRALESFQGLLTRSTTYGEHFHQSPSGIQPSSRLDYSFRSRESQRPWTTESRGKYSCPYNTLHILSPLTSPSQLSEHSWEEGNEDESLTDNSDTAIIPVDVQYKKMVSKEEIPSSASEVTNMPVTSPERVVRKGVEMVSVYTQTEDEYFCNENQMLPSPENNKFPEVSSDFTPNRSMDILTSKIYKLPMIERPITATVPEGEDPQHVNKSQFNELKSPRRDTILVRSQGVKNLAMSHRVDDNKVSTPRTVEATRRMADLYNGFSRSEILKQFNHQYQEKAPDLRRYSIREGKRHVINGTHSYYYH